MITIDLECCRNHRFEGFFKDHESFCSQLDGRMIICPVCGSYDVRRIFSGCSIPRKTSAPDYPSGYELLSSLRYLKEYIKENCQDVGEGFADRARAIHYGLEEDRNIFGSTSVSELTELADEGVPVLAIPDIEIPEN